MGFNAIILAGSRPGEDASEVFSGYSHKALIELQKQTLLARVAAAVKEAGGIRIAVSCDEGPVAQEARDLGLDILPPASGPSGSVQSAFEHLGAPLLVTTADHALLKADWIGQLIGGAADGCDLALMMASKDAVELAMPGSKRTYLRFADGHWSGCNLFYLQTPQAGSAIRLWQRIEADRKRPWRIAMRLGLSTIISYAFGRLSLSAGLGKLGQRIGVQISVVSAADGLAAVDIDKPQDLADVRKLLGEP